MTDEREQPAREFGPGNSENQGEPSPETGTEGVPTPETAAVASKPSEPRPGVLDILYGVLFEPGPTFRRLVDDPPAGLALAVFFAANFLGVLAGASSGAGSVGLAVGILALGFGFWLLGTPVLGLMAEVLGGQGRLLPLFLLLGLATLPSIFDGPVQLLGRVSAPLAGLGGTVVTLWTFVLTVVALREAYRLSTGRAFLAIILPLGALVAILIVALVAIIVGAATSPELLQQLELLGR